MKEQIHPRRAGMPITARQGTPITQQAPSLARPAQSSPHDFCRRDSRGQMEDCARRGGAGMYCVEFADRIYELCMKWNSR
jgi:hypothetical protein